MPKVNNDDSGHTISCAKFLRDISRQEKTRVAQMHRTISRQENTSYSSPRRADT